MANKSKVYTKSGDKGQTSLVGGQRVNKSDHRIDLYGDVDELNSHIGVSASHIDLLGRYEAELNHLKEIQSLLFDLGSNLACEPAQRGEFKLPQIKISSSSCILVPGILFVCCQALTSSSIFFQVSIEVHLVI